MSRKQPPSELIEQSVATAQFMALASRDPSSRHGLFFWKTEGAVKDSPVIRILSQGFNNFPSGVSNTKKRWHTRALKYDLVVHAEERAIAQAARTGTKLKGSTLTMVGFPCLPCASMVVESGTKHLIFDASKMDGGYFERWRDDFIKTKALLDRKKIDLYPVGATPALDDLFAETPPRLREDWHKNWPVSAYLWPIKDDVFNHYINESRNLPAIIRVAEDERAKSPDYVNKDSCVFFKEHNGDILVAAHNRPVLGYKPSDFKDEAGFQAAVISAPRLAVAHAARDGVKLDGATAYLTRHPGTRDVGMLVTAGIKNIIVDVRELEMDLNDPSLKDSYSKAKMMLNEAGVDLQYLTGLDGPKLLKRSLQLKF